MTTLGRLALIVFAVVKACAASANDTTNSTDSGLDKCQVSGNSTLDVCLERFARKWDEIRRVRPQVDAIVFPILAMTSDELKPLCSRLEEAQDGCGSAIDTCQSHEITRFVQQNFVYGCSQKQSQSLFPEKAECLLSTISGQQQCLTLLKKSADQPDACAQLDQFFKCAHDEVYRSCQAKGLAALVHAIDRFGCDAKKLDAQVGNPKTAPTCAVADWQAVAACFQPLLSLWSAIRDNDTSFLDTAFPLFKFDRPDLVKMCDMVRVIRDRCFVQIQRCPGHQLPEFANAILGLVCGTQQSAFFLSYDCIRSMVLENEQCQPYTVGAWQPGHLKEICGRMPQYYKCLEKPVTAKCGHDAVTVLAQTIRQYGCELNTDSSADTRQPVVTTTTISDATAATAVPVTETPPPLSTQPPTDGILDFAASPPSHTALPPAPAAGPGVSAPQSNLRPFLQEPQPGASFFLALPVPPPSLVPGGPETFFSQNLANEQQPLPSPIQPSLPASIQPAPPAAVLLPASIQPAPPAAVLLEPQEAPVSAHWIPVPQPFAPFSNSSTSPTSTTPTTSSSASSTPASTTAPASTVLTTPTSAAVAAATSSSSTTVTLPSSSAASTSSSDTRVTPTSPSLQSTTSNSTATTPAKGAVVPIPTAPWLLALCNLEKRNQLRQCLNPLYRRWVEVHGKMMSENGGANLTFPIYHYAKSEVVELCDHYASAFLGCSFSLFQECLTDDVVYLANAIFGYVCSPQNVGDFSRFFDCISTVVRQRTQCMRGVEGTLLTVSQGSTTRCQGAREFYSCNKWQIEQSCTSGAEKVFGETVRQFGCELRRH